MSNGADGTRALDFVTIGETMLRLSAPVGVALERAERLEVEAAGAESNVAVDLARLGWRTAWISRLPANPLGRSVASRIRQHGVDISRVIWVDDDARLGLCFVESPVPPRRGRVLYDRADSAFARIRPDEVDWAFVSEARFLHLTGITPALSAACLELVRRALGIAARSGVTVSFDLNYRAGLWSPQEAADQLSELLPSVDVLIATAADVRTLFGLECSAGEQAQTLAGRFGCEIVAVTDGADGAVAWHDQRRMLSQEPAVEAAVVDRIGRGDAFAAGFLYALDKGTDAALRCGVALAALKQTYRGDFAWATVEDLDAIVAGDRTEMIR